jgi:hypothetical protein
MRSVACVVPRRATRRRVGLSQPQPCHCFGSSPRLLGSGRAVDLAAAAALGHDGRYPPSPDAADQRDEEPKDGAIGRVC